jgi:hypothetical protein
MNNEHRSVRGNEWSLVFWGKRPASGRINIGRISIPFQLHHLPAGQAGSSFGVQYSLPDLPSRQAGIFKEPVQPSLQLFSSE